MESGGTQERVLPKYTCFPVLGTAVHRPDWAQQSKLWETLAAMGPRDQPLPRTDSVR